MKTRRVWLAGWVGLALAAGCNSSDDSDAYFYEFINQSGGSAMISVDGVVEDHILAAGQSKKYGVDKDAGYNIRPERTSGLSGVSPIPAKALSATVTFTITDDRVATRVEWSETAP